MDSKDFLDIPARPKQEILEEIKVLNQPLI